MQYLIPRNAGLFEVGVMAVAGLLVAGLIANAQPEEQPASAPAKEKPPRAVVDTHELMELFNQPLLKYMKREMNKPENERQWQSIADRGWQVAEVANLVALRNDQPMWIQRSTDLQQAGIQLAKTAKSEDLAATNEAYRAVIQKCNACHQTMGGDHAPELQP